MTVDVWLKLTAGRITPSTVAPGKSNAPTVNPGKKLIKLKKRAILIVNITRPKVRWLIGKSTREKIGFMIWTIKNIAIITKA